MMGVFMPLFGTDGVRGVVNDTLTVALATRLARTVGSRLGPGARVVVGRDTRVSGPLLEAASMAGLLEVGVQAVSVGVVPTPAVAFLVPALGADAGLVISASHNAPEYNGLKWLARDGRKFSEEEEAAVASAYDEDRPDRVPPAQIGSVNRWPEAVEQYQSYLVSVFAGQIPPLNVVVDLGHGAASRTVVSVLERLGCRVSVLFGEPHGHLINVGCGATHPEQVADAVRRGGFDVGLTFDGDADRVMAADADGHILNGDAILLVLARALAAQNRLAGRRVISTVMSNLGLERALHADGIALERTQVGDRYVAARMVETGSTLGGEQSGHVILSDWSVTGDGLLTALALLREMHRTGEPLAHLTTGFVTYPQVLTNVKLGQIPAEWDENPAVIEALNLARQALGEEGRVVVRPSGTEPLLRIMLEGRDEGQIHEWADRLAAVVQEALGSATAPSESAR